LVSVRHLVPLAGVALALLAACADESPAQQQFVEDEPTTAVAAEGPPAPGVTDEPVATAAPATASVAPAIAVSNCDPSYPDVCIPPNPPDLDCGDIPHRRFRVLPPDPHKFDGSDGDGIGCEGD
jgi:hypothetical protein